MSQKMCDRLLRHRTEGGISLEQITTTHGLCLSASENLILLDC